MPNNDVIATNLKDRAAQHEALRPTTVDDLAEYYQHGDQVATVDVDRVPPEAFAAIGGLLATMAQVGEFEMIRINGNITLHAPLTDKQLVERLESANRTWDLQRQTFEQAVLEETLPAGWSARTGVQTYAGKIGFEIPETWPIASEVTAKDDI